MIIISFHIINKKLQQQLKALKLKILAYANGKYIYMLFSKGFTVKCKSYIAKWITPWSHRGTFSCTYSATLSNCMYLIMLSHILCANLFHFCFSFSKIVVRCLKCWLSKRWVYSSCINTRTKKPLQRKVENIGFDLGWEIDSCLDVIRYSKKPNVIRKLLEIL